MNNREYELNMPKDSLKVFNEALDKGEWTWSGIAELLRRRFGKSDIDDFVYWLTQQST